MNKTQQVLLVCIVLFLSGCNANTSTGVDPEVEAVLEVVDVFI